MTVTLGHLWAEPFVEGRAAQPRPDRGGLSMDRASSVVYCRLMDEIDDDQDVDFTPWTPEGAQRLKDTAREAARALLEHADRLGRLGSNSEFREVMEASDRLAPALLAVADAQFEYTGNYGPLGLLHGYGDEDDEDDEVQPVGPVPGISVLQRHDYEVTDESAVIAAGQQAYLRVWEDDTPEQAKADVTNLGRALYQIAHDRGSWSLDKVEGLRSTGGAVVITPTDEALGPDPTEWPDALFEHDAERTLYSQSDVCVD